MLARTGEDNDGQKMNEVLTFLEWLGHFFVHAFTSKFVAVIMKITNPILNFIILNNIKFDSSYLKMWLEDNGSHFSETIKKQMGKAKQ